MREEGEGAGEEKERRGGKGEGKREGNSMPTFLCVLAGGMQAGIYLSSRFKNAPAYGWDNLALQRMRAISALSVTYTR